MAQKQIYLDEVERIAAELEEGGMESGKAFELLTQSGAVAALRAALAKV